MAIEITVPRLGWSMDEGTFGEWLKQDGDQVDPGEPVFTLESDKSVQEVESVDGGTLHILPDGPQEGDPVEVGTLVGFLLEHGEPPPSDTVISTARSAANLGESDHSSEASPAVRRAADESLPAVVDEVTSPPAKGLVTSSTTSADTKTGKPQRRLISPRAARVAGELGVDWSALTGTGRNGRIREQDIRAAAGSSGSSRETQTTTVFTSSLRRTIAERMLHSVQTTAPVTLTTRVDATNLVSLRRQFRLQSAEIVPAYHDIIARLTAVTLRHHPIMNCQWRDGEIVEPDGVHIGIAVDTESGLLVPVIRDCDRLSLTELTRRSSDLVTRARERKCSPEELTGGTFSITNLGVFGIDAFTPIINTPQTAVLGIGAIRREPVVLEDDRIEAREQLTLSLTFDHQVTDGAPLPVSSRTSPAPSKTRHQH